MPGLLAAYLVALGAALFAVSCALTFQYVVRHLDPPEDPNGVRPSPAKAGPMTERVHGEAIV
jgi:hypothetical protein